MVKIETEEQFTIDIGASIVRYRGTNELIRRSYGDAEVGQMVVSLSTFLKIAVFQGYDRQACDIAWVLAYCEPLEMHPVWDYEGYLLRIAMIVYGRHDLAAAREIVSEALSRFSDDPRLLRIAKTLGDEHELKETMKR